MVGLALAPLTGAGASSPTSESDAAAALARDTLAKKMRGDAAEYELVSAEPARILRAGSGLGCDAPPASEGEGEVSGWRVRLRLGEDTFDLVVGEGRARLCNVSSGEPAAPVRRAVERELAAMVDEARADLARRLSIRPETIDVLEATSVVWRDSSAGCPEKGMVYLQVLTPGARIRLEVGGRQYSYHSREGHTPFLCERPSPTDPLPAEAS